MVVVDDVIVPILTELSSNLGLNVVGFGDIKSAPVESVSFM